MAEILIGLDPGVNTGVAFWDTKARKLVRLLTCSIVRAMDEIDGFRGCVTRDVEVVFEDARKRKWIPREKSLSQFKGRAMGAGSVRRDCDIWEEYCTARGIPFEAVPPRPGVTKWSAETFEKVTGWKGRTSNHARDAALLVFGKH